MNYINNKDSFFPWSLSSFKFKTHSNIAAFLPWEKHFSLSPQMLLNGQKWKFPLPSLSSPLPCHCQSPPLMSVKGEYEMRGGEGRVGHSRVFAQRESILIPHNSYLRIVLLVFCLHKSNWKFLIPVLLHHRLPASFTRRKNLPTWGPYSRGALYNVRTPCNGTVMNVKVR